MFSVGRCSRADGVCVLFSVGRAPGLMAFAFCFRSDVAAAWAGGLGPYSAAVGARRRGSVRVAQECWRLLAVASAVQSRRTRTPPLPAAFAWFVALIALFLPAALAWVVAFAFWFASFWFRFLSDVARRLMAFAFCFLSDVRRGWVRLRFVSVGRVAQG